MKNTITLNPYSMLRNYFIVSLRNQIRNKGYFLINLFGLTLGIVTSLFGFLWIRDELSVNNFHHEIEKIAQVKANWQQSDGSISTIFQTPEPVYEAVKNEVPEVQSVTRVTTWSNTKLIKHEDKSFLETGIYADPEFLYIFNFPLLSGDKSTAISQSNTIAISEELARKYFGTGEAIGKVFDVNGRLATVSAIFKNVPLNSTIQFDFIMPFKDFITDTNYSPDWTDYDFWTFVKLNEASDISTANAKFESMIIQHLDDEKVNEWLFLQPFEDTYLHSKFENGAAVGGRIEYIRIFGAAIIFLLIIACINFVNLATSRAANRAKEVGVRKVNGAQKAQLIFQFLSESFLIALISLITSIFLVELTLPAFNVFVEKSIIINHGDPILLFGIGAILVVTTAAAGLYPAFYLSSLKPALVVKGSIKSPTGFSLRKFLVAFQFGLSVILLISAMVVSSQVDFIRQTNLGFDRENIVQFPSRPGITRNFDAIRNEMLQNPEIVNLGVSNQLLLDVRNSTTSVSWPGMDENEQIQFRAVLVGMDFLETLGIELSEGRLFNRNFPQLPDDSIRQYIISRKSVEVMGLDNPIGSTMRLWGRPGTIVGVVEDFNSKSIHSQVDPIVFMLQPGMGGRVYVKLQSDQTQAGLTIIEDIYKKYEKEYPFEYAFMDQIFDRQYRLETLTGQLANMFTAMAIAISCLGLFGLTAYLIEKRTREIGIRKVLGASVTGLIFKLSADFIKLFGVALVLGIPSAYFLMEGYLQKFAYHTEFDPMIVLMTAGVLFLISLLTIIYNITKAALANPAEILRNE